MKTKKWAGLFIVACVMGAGLVSCSSFKTGEVASEPKIFNVKSFGAVGDGVAMETAALQKAIDACHANKGGRVSIPTGRYLTGTLKLKSNVELELEKGSELLGSLSLADYAKDNQGAIEGPAFDECRLYAENARNIKITGKGVINGQGARENFPIKLEDGSLDDRPMLIRFVEL